MRGEEIGRSLAVLVSLLGCLAVAGGGRASTLAVTPPTAMAGGYGLEVTVDTSCAADHDAAVPEGDISGTQVFEGCRSLSAADAHVLTGGDVTLRAGDQIILGNGFSVANGAALTATLDPAMTGRAYVQDDSPAAENLYRARFYVDLSSLSLGTGDGFEHFSAYTSTGAKVLELRLEDNGAGFALVVSARHGASTLAATAEPTLPSSYFAIEFEWRGSDIAASNGYIDVWIDGTQVTGLTGLDNEGDRIDHVRWGVVDIVDNTTSGTMNLDEFVSRRSSATIGTLP